MYSDIFEQHRLSLLFGVQIQINIFGVWRFLIFASGMSKKPKQIGQHKKTKAGPGTAHWPGRPGPGDITCHRVRRFDEPWQAANASLLEKCSLCIYLRYYEGSNHMPVAGYRLFGALWQEIIARFTSPA